MECSWPRGCFESRSVDGYCYYHSKVLHGLITADWYLLESHTAKPPPARRVALARTLARAGASEDVVHVASSTQMFPAHHARHGNGFIRSGILHARS